MEPPAVLFLLLELRSGPQNRKPWKGLRLNQKTDLVFAETLDEVLSLPTSTEISTLASARLQDPAQLESE